MTMMEERGLCRPCGGPRGHSRGRLCHGFDYEDENEYDFEGMNRYG
jgi:hypothetical protein